MNIILDGELRYGGMDVFFEIDAEVTEDIEDLGEGNYVKNVKYESMEFRFLEAYAGDDEIFVAASEKANIKKAIEKHFLKNRDEYLREFSERFYN